MRRRQFISALAGAAAMWPLAARAQQPGAMRRVAVLMNLAPNDLAGPARIAALLQGLQQLGWKENNDFQIDIRWAGANADNVRKYATEIVSLAPDIILAAGSAAAGPVLQATRTIPVVFVHAPDPVGAGFVDSLAQPGGNATGFTNFEYGLSGKWLELLKEIAPAVTRVAVLRDAAIAAGTGQLGAIQSIAPSLRVEVSTVNVRDAGEIERAVTNFARSASGGGLILTASALTVLHRHLIITLAAQQKLPTIYFERFFATDGGLISYGPEIVDQFRQSAGYVDRILKGEKPAEMPVRTPTKYELLINLKTAKALNLAVPQSLLARADEVIE